MKFDNVQNKSSNDSQWPTYVGEFNAHNC